MPGIVVSLSVEPISHARAALFTRALAVMTSRDDNRVAPVKASAHLSVGWGGYSEYPIKVIPGGRDLVVLEGYVYNKPVALVEEELRAISTIAWYDADDAREKAKKWVSESDGDYLVLMASLENDAVILFSDTLGRLPLYAYQSPQTLLIARRLSPIRTLLPRWCYDEVAVGQMIWLGYPLGGRTPLRQVCHLPPSLWMQSRLRLGMLTTKVQSLRNVNFDEQLDVKGDTKNCVAYASDLLVDACRGIDARCRPGPRVISLSGGMDSRAVAAGMVKAGVSCVGATYVNNVGSCKADVSLAEPLARVLGMEWERFVLVTADGRDSERLVAIKDGLNYVDMSFILRFFDLIKARWGRDLLYLTGDGGGMLKGLPRVVSGLLRKKQSGKAGCLAALHGLGRTSPIEQLLGLASGSLTGELEALAETFPEEVEANRLVHYEVYERGRRWLFEGEDRNRQFFWSATPLLSLPLFDYCRQLPERLKRNNAFYRAVVVHMSPAAGAVPEAYAATPPASRWYCASVAVKTAVSRLKIMLAPLCGNSLCRRRWRARDEAVARVVEALPYLLEHNQGAGERLREFLDQTSARQFAYLQTLAALANQWGRCEMETSNSSL